ncbi:MAG: T9SS type A sorting domain-containing protein, partial [Bacteroidia bacterium]
NTANDSMTVILVNRSLSSSKTVTVNISNFAVPNGTYTTKRLSGLPASETFVSNAVNALSTGTATVASNSLTITLPSLSTTAVILKGVGALGINDVTEQILHAKLYPNPAGSQNVYIDLSAEKINDVKVQVYSTLGQLIYSKQYDGQNPSVIEIPSNMMTQGVYIVNLSSSNGKKWSSRLVKM